MGFDREAFNRVFRNVVNRVATAHVYGLWSDDTARREVHEVYDQLEAWLTEQNLQWGSLSKDDLQFLGFKSWSEPDEEGNVLMLAPLYLLPVLPDGLVLTSIRGAEATIGTDEIDNDVRLGCIAYGLKVKEDAA